jgi:hypothetical protein
MKRRLLLRSFVTGVISFCCIPVIGHTDKKRGFELGKCYRHTDMGKMKIVGMAETTQWGKCGIGEEVYRNRMTNLIPVSLGDEVAATNWIEISEEEWMESFS